MEGIPTYINKLENAQKQSNRAGNPITDPTLLLFAANTMLRTDRFPLANDIWEDLPGANPSWLRWKTIYRKADMDNIFKKAAQGGKITLGHMVPLTRYQDQKKQCHNFPLKNSTIILVHWQMLPLQRRTSWLRW